MPSTVEMTNSIERLLEQIEHATGQTPEADAKRASWRYEWVVPATVELADSPESLFVTIQSISAQGLDFRSPRTLEPGCKVLITLETDEGELRIPATVIHSRESVGMPIVGVAFDLDSSAWA